jgi:hypothetical protein
MSGYYFAWACCLALVVFLVVLLRRRRLREKYALTWIVVALGVCVLGAFPGVIENIASAVGVVTRATCSSRWHSSCCWPSASS